MNMRNRDQAVTTLLVFLLPALAAWGQAGISAKKAETPGLPYYTQQEILVFSEASRQYEAAREFRRERDFERWANSVAELFDLAGRIEDDRNDTATSLAISYGQAAIEDLVAFVEQRQSHRGSVQVQRILGNRIGSRAFPTETYQQRLQMVIDRYDRLCEQLRSKAGYQTTAEQRQALTEFIRNARGLDVEPSLIQNAVETEIEDLVERVKTTANVREANELLRQGTPLFEHLSRKQKKSLKRVAGAHFR